MSAPCSHLLTAPPGFDFYRHWMFAAEILATDLLAQAPRNLSRRRCRVIFLEAKCLAHACRRLTDLLLPPRFTERGERFQRKDAGACMPC